MARMKTGSSMISPWVFMQSTWIHYQAFGGILTFPLVKFLDQDRSRR